MDLKNNNTDEQFETFKEEINSFIKRTKDTRLEFEKNEEPDTKVEDINEDTKEFVKDNIEEITKEFINTNNNESMKENIKDENTYGETTMDILKNIKITNYDEEEKVSDMKDFNVKKKSIIGMIISSLFIPGFLTLFIIGTHTSYLIRPVFFFIVTFIFVASVMWFLYSLYDFIKSKEDKNSLGLKTPIKIIYGTFMGLYIIGVLVFLILMYGPSYKFKDWLVTTAMSTMNHQYLCKWFYSDAEIREVQGRNYVKEPEGSTDPSLIGKDDGEKVVLNEYEKELLTHEPDEKYKIVKFQVNGENAYMAAIFDPSLVHAEVTKDLGWRGEYVTQMAERNNAFLAINAGGFVEDGVTLGGKPTGITIVNGQVITNNEYDVTVPTGGLIGLTEDNVLVLLKNATAEQALEMGVRDAVSWGPFLIVNGESSTIVGNGGWGGGARSAIGQRKDGTILFLVVDSNAQRTSGANMEDLVQIMERYGAYNAANLDGGTSSVLVLPKDVAQGVYGAPCDDYFNNYACAINDPIDAAWIHRTRYIATAFVVTD